MSTEEMPDQLAHMVKNLKAARVADGWCDVEVMMWDAARKIEELFEERGRFLDQLTTTRGQRDELREDSSAAHKTMLEVADSALRMQQQRDEARREMEALNARLAPVIEALRDWAENENPTLGQGLALADAWNTWKDNA